MRSSNVVPGQAGYAQEFTALRSDARGAGNLLVHQQLGALALGTAPTNGQTITITINGAPIVLTAVGTLGTTPGNVLNPGTAAGFIANVLALLTQPQTTSATGVALSTADQQLLSYLSWALSGTTITPCSNNTSLYAPLSTFTVATNVTSGTWTAQTMHLYIEPGVVYVGGTRVIYAGGSSPTVTAPASNPRIDVLTIDGSGTLAWTTGSENASPVAPTYPANKVALCEVYNVVGETALYDNENQQSGQGYIYHDVRPTLGTAVNLASVAEDILPDGDGTRNLGSMSFEFSNLYVKNGIFLNGQSINAQVLSAFTAGQSLTPGIPVCALPFTTTPGTFDTNLHGSGSGTTVTQAFSVASNSNRILLVPLCSSNGSNYTVSGITYAGVSMTLLKRIAGTGSNTGNSTELWYLLAPATGSNNIVITSSNSGNSVTFNAYSYYDIQQIVPAETNSGVVSTGTAAISITPTVNGSIVFGMSNLTTTPTGNVYANNALTTGMQSADSGTEFPPVASIYSVVTGSSNTGIILCVLAPIQTSLTARLYKTTSAIAGQTNGFIGFTQGTASTGGSITVATAGVDENQSGLTIGAQYYLNDTAGTIGTSPGTNTRKAGIAVDTTKLLITNIW